MKHITEPSRRGLLTGVAGLSVLAAMPARAAPSVTTKENLISLLSQNDSVRVDGIINMPDIETGLDKFINGSMYGSGTVRGIPGKGVIPDNAPYGLLELSADCRPSQFPNFNAAKSKHLLIIGDSISTPGHNNNFVIGGTQSLLLQRQLQSQLGTTPLEVTNISIGGAALGSVMGKRTDRFPPWWDDKNALWVDYLKKYATPGTLIAICFGMNVEEYQAWATDNVMERIPSTCDVALVTNFLPSPNPKDPGWDIQAAHLEQMSYTRHYALRNNIGLIDVGRAMVCARDGYDVRSNIPYQNFANLSPAGFKPPLGTITLSGGMYTPNRPVDGAAPVPVKCRNFSWYLRVPPYSPSNIEIVVGSGMYDKLTIKRPANGPIDLRLTHGDKIQGERETKVVKAWKPLPTDPEGSVLLGVEVVDNMVIVYAVEMDADKAVSLWTTPVMSEPSLRMAKPFVPTINEIGGKSITALRFDLGQDKFYKPVITNREAFGTSSDDLPYGGQGINHETVLLDEAVLKHTISQAVFVG